MHLASLLAAAAGLLSGQSESCLALGGFDPVALTKGVEKEGLGSIALARHVYEYRFANEENRGIFQASPERYEIQLGGGCGRMGPLAGRGDPARFLVHEERIYVFASDVCRETFSKDPSLFLDADEPLPEGDAAAREKGNRLVERAIEAIGGLERLGKLRAFQSKTASTTASKDGPRTDTTTRTIVFPLGHRLDETWGDWRGSYVVGAAAAFHLANDGSAEDLHPAAVRELRRQVLRQPLAILRSSREPGFVAVAMETSVADGTEVELVAVGLEGTTTVLGIDPKNGRVLSVGYRGRGSRSSFLPIQRAFSDFREAGGMVLPHRERVAYDGHESEPERSLEVRVDPDLPAGFLEKP